MNEEPNDITNNVYYPKNDPWETVDRVVGFIRNALAAIGMFSTFILILLLIEHYK